MVLAIAAMGLIVASTVCVVGRWGDLILVQTAGCKFDARGSTGILGGPITNKIRIAGTLGNQLNKASAAGIACELDKITEAGGPHAALIIAS